MRNAAPIARAPSHARARRRCFGIYKWRTRLRSQRSSQALRGVQLSLSKAGARKAAQRPPPLPLCLVRCNPRAASAQVAEPTAPARKLGAARLLQV